MVKALLGAALIMASTTSAGLSLAAEKRNRALYAEGFLALVEHIEASLPSLAVLEDIIKGFDNKALRRAGVMDILKAQNSALPCNKRLMSAIELQAEDKALYSVLSPLAKELGSTDYTKQLKSLGQAKVALSTLCAARRGETENSERCYKWLGVLAGAMAVILLI